MSRSSTALTLAEYLIATARFDVVLIGARAEGDQQVDGDQFAFVVLLAFDVRKQSKADMDLFFCIRLQWRVVVIDSPMFSFMVSAAKSGVPRTCVLK